MKTANEVKNEVTKDIHISILKDTLSDLRSANLMMKKTVYILFVLLTLAIGAIIWQGAYYQHKLFKFMDSTEFTSEYFMDNDTSNLNNMHIERK